MWRETARNRRAKTTMKQITAAVPDELLEELDDKVNWRHESRSKHVRNAIRLWIELGNPEEMIEDRDDVPDKIDS